MTVKSKPFCGHCIARGANVLRDTSVACFKATFNLEPPPDVPDMHMAPSARDIRPCLPGDRMTQCLDFVAPDPNLELHTLGGYGLLVIIIGDFSRFYPTLHAVYCAVL